MHLRCACRRTRAQERGCQPDGEVATISPPPLLPPLPPAPRRAAPRRAAPLPPAPPAPPRPPEHLCARQGVTVKPGQGRSALALHPLVGSGGFPPLSATAPCRLAAAWLPPRHRLAAASPAAPRHRLLAASPPAPHRRLAAASPLPPESSHLAAASLTASAQPAVPSTLPAAATLPSTVLPHRHCRQSWRARPPHATRCARRRRPGAHAVTL
jgi:hypothetical protein